MKKNRPVVQQSNREIMRTIRQLQIAYRLKHTLRYHGTRPTDIHGESVAEHVFALLFLAEYFLPLEDPKRKLDREKLYQILLFHDFGEITHGDVPYHLKTRMHQTQEERDAKKLFASLPPTLGKTAYKAWQSFEDQRSDEAHFAYALDKIEPIFELLNPVNERSLKRLRFTYENHIGVKMRATERFPIMRRFLEAATEDMLKRNVFWQGTNDKIRSAK